MTIVSLGRCLCVAALVVILAGALRPISGSQIMGTDVSLQCGPAITSWLRLTGPSPSGPPVIWPNSDLGISRGAWCEREAGQWFRPVAAAGFTTLMLGGALLSVGRARSRTKKSAHQPSYERRCTSGLSQTLAHRHDRVDLGTIARVAAMRGRSHTTRLGRMRRWRSRYVRSHPRGSRVSRFFALLLTVISAGLTGCGQQDSYEAAESGLREWLEAVHEGDAAACDLMTAKYRRELAAEVNPGNTACRQAMESAGPAASDGLPSAQSEMEVPAWDPSGEALLVVTDDERDVGFWMQFMEGRWLVAGKAN